MQAIARPDTNRYMLFIIASIAAHFILAGMVGVSNHFQWWASTPDPEPLQRETPVMQMVNQQDILPPQPPPSVDNFVPSNPNAPQEENHSKAESDVSQKAHTRDAPRNLAAEQMDMRGHKNGEYTEVHTKSSRQQEQVDPGSKENRKAEKTEKQQQQPPDQKQDPTQDQQQQKSEDPPNKSKLKNGTAKQEPKHDPSEQPPQEGAPTGEATEPPKMRPPTAQPTPDPLDRPPTTAMADPLAPKPPTEYDPSALPVLPPAPLSYKEQKEREAAQRMSEMKKNFRPMDPSQAGSPLRQAPAQASQGFNASRSEVEGRGTQGEYSPDVTESEIGKYKAKMRRAVGSRWRLAVSNNLSTLSIGSIQIKFYVQANGVLSNLEIVDDSSHSNTAVLRGISRDALLKAMPFDPFSETMKQKLGAGYQEEYTFSIY